MGIFVSTLDLNGGGGFALASTYTADYSTNGNVNPGLYKIIRGQGNPASTDFINVAIATNDRTSYQRSGGTGNVVSLVHVIPVNLINQRVSGQNQFAEGKLLNTPGAGSETGPAVLLQGDPVIDQGLTDGGNGYGFVINGDGNCYLRRSSITATVIGPIPVTTWAINDVFRIEVRGPSTNWEIKLFKNGTLQATVNDNAATRPLGLGYPGWACDNLATTGTIQSFGSQSWGLL